MSAVEFNDVASGRACAVVAAATAVADVTTHANNPRKGRPARAIMYKGALTITDGHGNSVALIEVTDYVILPVQVKAVTGSPANSYMLIW